MTKWPLKYRVWFSLHQIINGFAWALVPDHEKHNKHWLWRFNNWVARHYTQWYIENKWTRKDG